MWWKSNPHDDPRQCATLNTHLSRSGANMDAVRSVITRLNVSGRHIESTAAAPIIRFACARCRSTSWDCRLVSSSALAQDKDNI
jgi:hypothetical protein